MVDSKDSMESTTPELSKKPISLLSDEEVECSTYEPEGNELAHCFLNVENRNKKPQVSVQDCFFNIKQYGP